LNTFLAVDWGTSSLRSALIAPDGGVSEERTFPRGILSVPAGEFPQVFENCFGDLMPPGRLCLISGMAGSRQGWLEAPYCACPAGFDELASQLAWIEPGRIAIVPGLSIEIAGMPDVMRGEETQVFGALHRFAQEDAVIVLPGTHSKWARVENNRVTHFSTWMTGEFYALLRKHSILARMLPEREPDFDAAAFERGVQQSLAGTPLLHSAFSVRSLSLFERLPADALVSYLSGLVIGEELSAQQLRAGSEVILIGADALTLRYERALALLDVSSRKIGNEATWHGLHRIAQAYTNR
jgi:2-dehydro-3-deoxygalactonokinase